MIYKCANAYYFNKLNEIGGVESHFYYMAKKYNNYDITIFYKHANPEQEKRLKKYVHCVKIGKNDRIICEKIFCCYQRDILSQCEAKERIWVLHSDYKSAVAHGQVSLNYVKENERLIDRVIGVSQLVCEAFEELTGVPAENVYQPVVLDPVEKPLMFISATRLTKEKGWNRMVKLAEALDKANVNYLWFIFTDLFGAHTTSKQVKLTKNMIVCPPRLDIADKYGGFDAYIQLSDSEAFCLSIVESLMRGTPVICTDLPVLPEIGVNEDNSIILDMNMESIPLYEIKQIRGKKFEYTPPQDKWDDILSHEKSEYDGDATYEVMALDTYQRYNIADAGLNRIPRPGEIFTIKQDRYDQLMGQNRFHMPFVRVLNKYTRGKTSE